MVKPLYLLVCLLSLVFINGCSQRYAFRKKVSVHSPQSISRVKAQVIPDAIFPYQVDSFLPVEEKIGHERVVWKKSTVQNLTYSALHKKVNSNTVLKRVEKKTGVQKNHEEEMNNVDKSAFFLTMTFLAFLLLAALPISFITAILLVAVFVALGMTIYYALKVFFDKQKGKGWAILLILLALLISFLGFVLTMLSWAKSGAGGP